MAAYGLTRDKMNNGTAWRLGRTPRLVQSDREAEMNCMDCGCDLIIGGNWRQGRASRGVRLCASCESDRKRAWRAENPEKYKTGYLRRSRSLAGRRAKNQDVPCTLSSTQP